MFDRETRHLVKDVLDRCREGGVMLATAESCTGGLIVAALTTAAGSSAVVERGFVTYSNKAKAEMLGVPLRLVDQHGAVSEQVARAMAEGALEKSHADIAVSVTGIAGPGGGSREKPVGLVHFACASRFGATQHIRMDYGDRDRDYIRHAAMLTGLRMVLHMLDGGAGNAMA